MDGDLELISGELSWAILDGGAVAPALALRLTGTQTTGGGAYDLDLYGAELELSKGFAVATPYVGAGAYAAAVLFLEPFYVATGFAQYLNRRAALEGSCERLTSAQLGRSFSSNSAAASAITVPGG